MLEAAGFGQVEEDVYQALLQEPGVGAAELRAATGATPRQVRRALESLEQAGLIGRVVGAPVRFMPSPPDLAIDALVLRRREELERLRVAGQQLAARFRRTVESVSLSELVQVIRGKDAVTQHVNQAQRSARREVLLTDRPPYSTANNPGFNDDQIEAMRRGVSYRCVYHGPALDLAGHADAVLKYVDAGEEARVLEDVPIKMLIADRTTGVLSLSLEDQEYDATIVVRGSTLLVTMIVAFEALWERAVPIVPRPGEGAPGALADFDRRLLVLLASGLKDEAVARQLGVSSRTVVRHVDRLMHELGAQTRFQAGLQAARRGWL